MTLIHSAARGFYKSFTSTGYFSTVSLEYRPLN